jgi:RNA polymerase sigma factor (sigma-70 family)
VHETLQRYLSPEEGDDPEDLLATLVVVHAQPVVRRVVARRLHGAQTDQLEDVCSEALASLIARLRVLHRDPAAATPIADFAAYVAGITANAVNQYLAAKYPERNRLRRRLRMVCTSDSRLRIWETPGGKWLCGRTGQAGEGRASGADLNACRSELGRVKLPQDLGDLVIAILKQTSQPVELSDLTQLCAGLLGLIERPQEIEHLEETLPDTAVLASHRTEMSAWVRQLWNEIRELPDRQRAALLLNLRSSQGAAIELIEDLGVATFGELANILGTTAEELSNIWNRLPLDDNEIAARLGVERQQVINLRSAARQRLQRRMSACQYRAERTNLSK